MHLYPKLLIVLVPGGGVEPPRPCDRRILSPYLLQIRDLRLYYLQQLTGCDGKVPCGPVRGYFGSLDIVLGIVSRNGFPADLPMPKTSATVGLRLIAAETPPDTVLTMANFPDDQHRKRSSGTNLSSPKISHHVEC
jgi:hypothetical protein